MKHHIDLYREPSFDLWGTVSLIVLVVLIMSTGIAVFVVAATILEHAKPWVCSVCEGRIVQ